MADTIRKIDYFYTTIPNKPGEGARVLNALKGAGVNLLAFHAFPGEKASQLDFFPQDAAAFTKAAKQANVTLSLKKTAFLAEGDDRVGAAADILGKLGAAKINVTAMDAVRVGGRFGAIVWVAPGDVDKAAKALGAK